MARACAYAFSYNMKRGIHPVGGCLASDVNIDVYYFMIIFLPSMM